MDTKQIIIQIILWSTMILMTITFIMALLNNYSITININPYGEVLFELIILIGFWLIVGYNSIKHGLGYVLGLFRKKCDYYGK